MPNIINPNCPSLPQQVEKNTQDILKLFASNLQELSGLEFNPTSLIYQQEKAIISGKFIVTRDEVATEINGVVTLPLKGENGVVVDASEDNSKIRIALDQTDRELFNYVQELVNRTTESDEIVFTSDMQNYVEDFVSEALEDIEKTEIVYDMQANDITKDWGFSNGLPTGYVADKDFTKYKKLIVYWQTNYICGTCEVDLTKDMFVTPGTYCGSSCGISWDGSKEFFGGVNIKIDNNKTRLNVEYLIYYNAIGDQDSKKVTKIVGVF